MRVVMLHICMRPVLPQSKQDCRMSGVLLAVLYAVSLGLCSALCKFCILWDTSWQKRETHALVCVSRGQLLVNSGTLSLIPHLYGPHDLRKGCVVVNKTCCDHAEADAIVLQLKMGARLSTAAAISLAIVSSCDAFAPSPLLKGASR
jgi:hypothetical protein